MSDVVAQTLAWLEAWHRVALVEVSAVEGSTPRPTGPTMAVRDDGLVVGSVSAGCVDGETHALAIEALETGEPSTRRYAGPSDTPEDADVPADLLDLGPTIMCGGAMTVTVRPLDASDAEALRSELAAREATRPLLLIYGAADSAAALSQLGALLGRRVIVCDPRAVFTSPARFPAAEVVVDRPERHFAKLLETGAVDTRTAVVVLTHDARTEDPLLTHALPSPVGYVGVLGSRRTHAARLDRLRAAGVPEADLARLRGPVGLHLGGVTAAETALSIVAEIVAADHGGTGLPLSATPAKIHPGEGAS
ncbi:XdhC family protein [Mobilicoccus pelagius]|uniref:Xanthine dehydrogenase accessory factor n=1 Tax=Mobilicoccus pelagius NBRC 104925 TaxID=1089455 RepID=H5URI4_9MICO|nr:XdhC/CoxI family protein [Mobilicoccus pelagius]GAB48342.1 hypothetical protein MOPEL_071_00580 [Mobilicoccus pelagius NBRC 104925]